MASLGQSRRSTNRSVASRWRTRGIGAARQHDGHERSDNDARHLRPAEVFELLGEHVAGLEIRNDEHVGHPGDGRAQAFDPSGLRVAFN